jgi:hypothetical protein
MRKIPLHEVQTRYFEILDEFFGKPFSEMKKNETCVFRWTLYGHGYIAGPSPADS